MATWDERNGATASPTSDTSGTTKLSVAARCAWGAVSGVGGGAIALALIEATDSHTGVGMGGFAVWLSVAGGAAIIAVAGAVLMAITATRKVGAVVCGVGVGLFITLVLGLLG